MKLDDLEGEVIADRFRLKSMIGKGGYGAVFEAIQLSVGRRCAVKIMLPARTDDEYVEERFRGEARTTSRLTHPNSIVLYDFGVDEERGFLFLATEFLDGDTLHEVMEREQTLSPARTLNIMEQMAGSLVDAHKHGLVHRDIKPKNIMLVQRAGKSDFVKVIDFGIAKALAGDLLGSADLTQTGMLIGTPQYMAPEQLLGTGLDERVDQYAMAVVGYKMLTGRNPFKAASAMETAMRHVKDRPLPLRTYRPELGVSADFEDAFLKALEKSPEHRFQNVMDFVEALKKAAADLPVQQEVGGAMAGSLEAKTVLLDAVQVDLGAVEEPAGDIAVEEGVAEAAQDEEVTAATKIIGRRRDMTTGVIAEPTRPARVRKIHRLQVVWGVVALSFLCFIAVAGALLLISSSPLDAAAEGGDEELHAAAVDRAAEVAEVADEVEEGEDQAAEDEEETQRRLQTEAALTQATSIAHLGVEAGQDEAAELAEEIARLQEEAEEARARRRSLRPANVTVTLIPWGTLYVGEARQSDATRQQIQLPPGRHELTLRQRGEVRARQRIDVEAGASTMVVLEAQFDR